MNREELIALANEVEYCIKNHVQPFLTERGWANVAAALRAQADSTSTPAQDGAEWLLNNKTNRAFHAALKKYPDAFEALHFFWNEGIAGTPSPERTSDGVREALVGLLGAARLLRDLVNEGGVPRYTVIPGAALNTVIEEDFDPAIERARTALSSTPTDALPGTEKQGAAE